MWLETINRVVKDIQDIISSVPKIDNMKELNKTELRLHNILQEYYGVIGNATREIKQSIRQQRINIRKMENINRAQEEEKLLEHIIEETPEQEIIDTTELTEEQKQEPEEVKKEVKPTKKKTTKKKTTKKADK